MGPDWNCDPPKKNAMVVARSLARMQRRTLLQMAALYGLISTQSRLVSALEEQFPVSSMEVTQVLLVAKCHLDVGFSLTQDEVMRLYFDVHYPAAMKTAAELRRSGRDRYTWSTGSWLLYEYLEQASSSQRRAMEEAIGAGDITWHALPFTWQTEMLDRSMIEGALSLSETLDRRFGHKTIGAKMTDVPGHSRGIIAPLHAHGIRVLDIGVNPASTPPDVPEVFLWRDPAGDSLAVLYHRKDYGSVIRIPGTNVAVDLEVRGDNSGPHTPKEIAAMYARLREQFPKAAIKASNMSEVATAIEPVRDRLPVLSGEIGDSWIYGCASDPEKVARYREVARLRRNWIERGRFAVGDDTDRALLRRLLLAVEHTWGTDTKTYLDVSNYRPRDLAKARDQHGYRVMEASWGEKRDDIDKSLATLPSDLRQEATKSLEKLRAARPVTEGMSRHNAAQPVRTRHFDLILDASTGAIVRLRNRRSGRDWASPEHPLALFTYQTLSAHDYAEFLKRYVTSDADWAPRDFGKPGIDNFNALSREWHPRLISCWNSRSADEDRLVLELAIDDAASRETGNVAWPDQFFLELRMPVNEARIDVSAITFGKVANRLPEALWLTFAPLNTGKEALTIDKIQQSLAPSDVVRGGGRAMHAISKAVRYRDGSGRTLQIHTLDAPVVAFGERSPLNFSLQLPALSTGIHFSLFNNAWGTNYPQWCRGDWAYRFRIFA
jgi:hypothetical protein